MQVAASEQNGITVLALSGRMDATTAGVFGDACRAALDGGARRIVVDLSGIEYISSAGLRVILTMLKAARALRGTAGLLRHAAHGQRGFQDFRLQFHAAHLRHGRPTRSPLWPEPSGGFMATLTLPATLEHLQQVNVFIGEHIPERFAGLVPQVELAAEELLVNVFSYAYPEGETGSAEVHCREIMLDGAPYFCFAVRDWGGRFDPFEEAPEPGCLSGGGGTPRGRTRRLSHQVHGRPLRAQLR